MAILGGAGNVGGSNPAGIGSQLNFAGNNFWAGQSGWLAISDGADAALFDFISPQRIALQLKLYYSFDYSVLNVDKFWGIEIKLNGETILKPRTDSTAANKIHGMPLENKVEFIVFGGDHVEIIGQTDDDATFCGGVIIAKGLYE